MSVAPNDAVLEAGLVIDTQRDDRPAAEYMAHVTTNHGLAVCMQTAAVLLVCGLQEPPLVGLQFAAAAAEVHCRHC